MANMDEKLRARYGGARFNPAEGQTHMSYQEWLDRHPQLGRNMKRGGLSEEDAMNRYKEATGAAGGQAWQDANPDWQTRSFDIPESQKDPIPDDIGASGPLGPPDAPPRRRGLGGPDRPPAAALAAAKRRNGNKQLTRPAIGLGNNRELIQNMLRNPNGLAMLKKLIAQGSPQGPLPRPGKPRVGAKDLKRF